MLMRPSMTSSAPPARATIDSSLSFENPSCTLHACHWLARWLELPMARHRVPPPGRLLLGAGRLHRFQAAETTSVSVVSIFSWSRRPRRNHLRWTGRNSSRTPA